MTQQVVIGIVAIAVSLVWCVFPTLIAVPVIRLVQPGAAFQASLGFLSGGGVDTLSAFILPLLGGLTIVKRKYFVPRIVIAIVSIFAITWLIAIIGYALSFGDTREAIFSQDLVSIRLALKGAIESSALYVLTLLGIKAKSS